MTFISYLSYHAPLTCLCLYGPCGLGYINAALVFLKFILSAGYDNCQMVCRIRLFGAPQARKIMKGLVVISVGDY